MTVRSDLVKGLQANMYVWTWEGLSSYYKEYVPQYPKVADVGDISEIKGGYWQGTSAVGASQLEELEDGDDIYQDNPYEGYTVYAKVKTKALKVMVPRSLQRDWHRTSDFIQSYAKSQWPKAIERTKEQIVADIFNYGGYTAGHKIFNNDIPGNLSTYTSPNLCYDGSPFFARTALHTAKDANTYLNAKALTGVTHENALTLYTLLTSTNAKMENGSPYDNSQNLVVFCNKSLEPDWSVIVNSTLRSDNAENATNFLKGMFTVVGSPYLTTSTFSAMGCAKQGVKVWFGKPRFVFWEKNDPPEYWAACLLDYAVCVQNWRPWVANNAPQS